MDEGMEDNKISWLTNHREFNQQFVFVCFAGKLSGLAEEAKEQTQASDIKTMFNENQTEGGDAEGWN